MLGACVPFELQGLALKEKLSEFNTIIYSAPIHILIQVATWKPLVTQGGKFPSHPHQLDMTLTLNIDTRPTSHRNQPSTTEGLIRHKVPS